MKISGAFNPTDLLEYSNDGFFITDVQGRLLYCNPATAPLVGLNLPEFGSMETLLKKKMINRSTAMEAIQKKSTVAGEVRSITGKRVMATSALVYNPAGRPDGVICNIRILRSMIGGTFSWESKTLMLWKITKQYILTAGIGAMNWSIAAILWKNYKPGHQLKQG